MRFEQIRYGRIGETVLGYIDLPGENRSILTLERNSKLIDDGFYHLVPFNGNRFKNTFAFIGADNSLYPELGITRSTCLYHSGDTYHDTIGCTVVGFNFHFNDDVPDINGGLEAMNVLREYLSRDENNYVTIRSTYGSA